LGGCQIKVQKKDLHIWMLDLEFPLESPEEGFAYLDVRSKSSCAPRSIPPSSLCIQHLDARLVDVVLWYGGLVLWYGGGGLGLWSWQRRCGIAGKGAGRRRPGVLEMRSQGQQLRTSDFMVATLKLGA
jgi:hypothetical protein